MAVVVQKHVYLNECFSLKVNVMSLQGINHQSSSRFPNYVDFGESPN